MNAHIITNRTVSAGTLTRTAALGLALTNQLLSAAGKSVLPIDNAQLGDHVNSGFVVNVAVIREVLGAGADGDQGHGHHQSKHQRKELLHSDFSSF